MNGRYEEALSEYHKIAEKDRSVAPENQLVANGLGWIYAVSGRPADALRIAQQFKDLSSHAYVDYYQLATIYSGLGDKEEAFRLLEKGYQERSASMPYLAIDIFWDNIRPDPRYSDLLRRVGLPQVSPHASQKDADIPILKQAQALLPVGHELNLLFARFPTPLSEMRSSCVQSRFITNSPA